MTTAAIAGIQQVMPVALSEEQILQEKKQELLGQLEQLKIRVDEFINAIVPDVDSNALNVFQENVDSYFKVSKKLINEIGYLKELKNCELLKNNRIEKKVLLMLQLQLLPELMNLLVQPSHLGCNYSFESLQDGWYLRITKEGMISKRFHIRLQEGTKFIAVEMDLTTAPDTQEAIDINDLLPDNLFTAFSDMLDFIGKAAENLSEEENVAPNGNDLSSSSSPTRFKIVQLQSNTTERLMDYLIDSKTDIVADTVHELVRLNFKEIAKGGRGRYFDFYCKVLFGQAGINGFVELLQKRSGSSLPCIVCNNLDELRESLQALNGSAFQGKIAFMVRANKYRKQPPGVDGDYHNLALLIEKGDAATKMCIMDSVGNKAMSAPNYPQYIQNTYQEIQSANFNNLTVYIPEMTRQRNTVDCPFFSLHDIEHFFQTEDFFTHLTAAGNAIADPQRPDAFLLLSLPPEHMAYTQSMSQLKLYTQDLLHFRTWPHQFEHLQQTMEQNVRMKLVNEDRLKKRMKNPQEFKKILSNGGETNMRAQDERTEYVHALSQLLNESSAREIKALATSHNVSHLAELLIAEQALSSAAS